MPGALTQHLYVEEQGEGEPLLLLEGLGQSMWAWCKQIPVFAQHFRMIAFDTRGTGRVSARVSAT
jgi:pimeloyl-ACP methyl ester carboxylesterase